MATDAISGVHATTSFTLLTNADDLSPALAQLEKVREYIMALPNVVDIQFERQLQLGTGKGESDNGKQSG